MKKEKPPPCKVELPMDLLSEVLIRLPMRSLLRCRRVCKSWRSLIASVGFAALHFAHHHDQDNRNTSILTYVCFEGSNRWMGRSPHTFKGITSKYYSKIDDNASNYPHNYYPCQNSVNGLLLFFKDPIPSDPRQTEIMLWNPTIGKAHKLPSLSIGVPYLGLGFCPSGFDYKVVAIAKCPLPSVHIYTLSTRTWRSVSNYRESIVHGVHSHGVHIEGAIFWITKDYEKEGSQMVSFDVENEVFDYITLPSNDLTVHRRHPVPYRKWVGLLDVGWPASILWVLEKDRAQCTWTKLYAIDLQVCNIPDIICFKKNGEFIFATRQGGIVLCNIETKYMKHLMKSHLFYYNEIPHYGTLYQKSLVLM